MLIPKENVKDLEQVPDNVRETITLVPVEDVREVLLQALCEPPRPRSIAPIAKEESPLAAQSVVPGAAESAAGLRA